MKKIIVILLVFAIYFYTSYRKGLLDIETRADYLISLMEDYNSANGFYPKNTEDILNVYYADYLMYDADNIPGKGYFIIMSEYVDKNIYGPLLVVGGWNPPNVIYFSKIKKKEVNSTYYTDSF